VSDEEYETQAEAEARIAALRSEVDVTPATGIGEIITEYAAFNDAEFWEPLFTSGELDDSLRFQLDAPLHTSNNLRSVVRFADLRNLERAEQGKVDKYGHVVVRVRTIVQSPWGEVSYDDIDDARGR
jgi:hypothetical protein